LNRRAVDGDAAAAGIYGEAAAFEFARGMAGGAPDQGADARPATSSSWNGLLT